MNAIEVVIINWKRPNNVQKIIQALKIQTIPCTITICDCHPSDNYALPESTIQKIDRLYRWKHNIGGYNRYLPLAAFDHPYTFFIDDDIYPEQRCLEFFLNSALKLNNKFSVLGQYGRIILPDGRYFARTIEREKEFKEVDFIVQAYFVKTSNLHHLLRFRWEIGYFEDELPEDDLLLCAALKYYQDLRCYLTPWDENEETLLNKHILDESFALSDRENHLYQRQLFIDRIIYYGWKPLYITGKNS